jgi:hypothetical protein
LLVELIENFCSALEVELNKAEYLAPELISFPSGSCEIISQMLALYLQHQSIKNTVYTKNQTNVLEIGSIHYWVVVNSSIIIDLTAHQFEEFEGDCILPIKSEFHAQFKQLQMFYPDVNSLGRPDEGAENLLFYKRLMSRLKTHTSK